MFSLESDRQSFIDLVCLSCADWVTVTETYEGDTGFFTWSPESCACGGTLDPDAASEDVEERLSDILDDIHKRGGVVTLMVDDDCYRYDDEGAGDLLREGLIRQYPNDEEPAGWSLTDRGRVIAEARL